MAPQSHNVGYGLIGATVLVYFGIAVSGAFYWYFQERAMFMTRGALAGAVYKKTTEAKLSAADDSAAITLMSTDVERIRTGLLNMHEFWANTIEVVLASSLLGIQLGAAVVAPIAVVFCCVVCSAILSKFIGPRQKAWMEKIQKRVGLTANPIIHMKHLRISGLTAPVEDLIQAYASRRAQDWLEISYDTDARRHHCLHAHDAVACPDFQHHLEDTGREHHIYIHVLPAAPVAAAELALPDSPLRF